MINHHHIDDHIFSMREQNLRMKRPDGWYAKFEFALYGLPVISETNKCSNFAGKHYLDV